MSSAVNDIPSVEFHLQLKRNQFKTPIELVKKNFKNIQKLIEKNDRSISKLIKTLNLITDDPGNTKRLKIIGQMKATQEAHIKKLKVRVAQHNEFINRLEIRLGKLQNLKRLELELQSADSKRDNKKRSVTLNSELMDFYSNEINLMVIEYLIKTSSNNFQSEKINDNIGVLLAKKLKMDKLIDYDVILQGLNIYNEIRYNKNLRLLIEWCSENKKALKLAIFEPPTPATNPTDLSPDKTSLEFETYLQQFIELVKGRQLYKALDIASTHLISYLKEDGNMKNEFDATMKKYSEDSNVRVVEDGEADEDDSNDDNSNETIPDDNFEKIKSGAALLFWNSINIGDILSTYTHSATSSDPLNSVGLNSSLYNSSNSSKAYYDQNRPILSKIGKNIKPYVELLDENKWVELADFFLYNFNLLYGIDQQLEFLIMLSTGITALKTKSCSNHNHNMIDILKDDANLADPKVSFDDFLHSKQSPLGLTNCPICSTELFELSSRFPFSHQVKSNIYDNPVMLPNGNLYQLENLIKFNENYQMSAASNKTSSESHVVLKNQISKVSEDAMSSESGKSTSNLVTSAIYSDEDDDDDDDSDYSSSGDESGHSLYDMEYPTFEVDTSGRRASRSSGTNDRRNSARKSFVDPVEWLKTLTDFRIRDPVTGENFKKNELVKVFPT